MTDEWTLKKKVDEIHLQYYDIDDIETLRQKLLGDMHYFIKDLFDFSQENLMKPIKSMEDYGEGKLKRINNKRFGIE